tara:strand:- start:8329 stop:8508 length:180 start_codon:yes stop_codon:yes gene_type:complete
MKGVKHYKLNGAEYNGATHKSNGQLMTGKTHTNASEMLSHKQKNVAKALRQTTTPKGYV